MVSEDKRIVTNTVMLYIRMLITTLVGVYTTRVVLDTLGSEDYGIYGVVGGIMSLVAFVNYAISGSVSRYLTFDLGKGNTAQLGKTFSLSFFTTIAVALFIVLLSETVGLWFFYQLVIPDERREAAFWVYQFSVVGMAVNITQAPYTALILAHEDMSIYAYFELLNVFCKLVIVYLIAVAPFDKLVFYAFLMLAVAVMLQMLNRVFAIRHYTEARLQRVWDGRQFREILSFACLNLYSNLSATIIPQGRSFLINFFFGVVVNAASSIALTVCNIIVMLSKNLTMAIRPQIVKAYAVGRIDRMETLVRYGAKYAFLMLLLVSVPLSFNIDYVMGLWLVNVPPYAADICGLLLLQNIFYPFSTYFSDCIQATGKLKRMLVAATVAFMQLPVVYVVFKRGESSPLWAYYMEFLFGLIGLVLNGLILHIQIPAFRFRPIVKDWLTSIGLSLLAVVPIYLFFVRNSLASCFLTFGYLATVLAVLSWCLFLDNGVKEMVRRKLSLAWHSART